MCVFVIYRVCLSIETTGVALMMLYCSGIEATLSLQTIKCEVTQLNAPFQTKPSPSVKRDEMTHTDSISLYLAAMLPLCK